MRLIITTLFMGTMLLNAQPELVQQIYVALSESAPESNKSFVYTVIKPLQDALVIHDGYRYIVLGTKELTEYIRDLLIHRFSHNINLIAYPYNLVQGLLADSDKELLTTSTNPQIANCFLESVLNQNPILIGPPEHMITISLSKCAGIIKIYKTSYEDFIQKFGSSISVRKITPYTPTASDRLFPSIIQFISIEGLEALYTSKIQMFKYTIHNVIPDLETFYEFIQLIDNKEGYFIYWSLEEISAWDKYIANFILGKKFCQANFRTYPEYFFPTCKHILANEGQRQRRAIKRGDLSKVPNISWDTIKAQIQKFLLVTTDGKVKMINADLDDMRG